MRSTVGIPLLPAQAVAEGQGGGGCQDGMKWPDYGPHNLKFPVGVPCCAR